MALRTIMTQEQATLHKKARPVTQFDEKLAMLLDDMAETLEKANGAGLAAPQVGILRRVFIVDLEDVGLLEMINPEILETSGEQDDIEGCLSLPGKWGMVKRPDHVKAKAQDRNGAWFEVEGDGLTARCILHEYDHLEGILYSEKVHHWLTEEEMEGLGGEDEDE